MAGGIFCLRGVFGDERAYIRRFRGQSVGLFLRADSRFSEAVPCRYAGVFSGRRFGRLGRRPARYTDCATGEDSDFSKLSDKLMGLIQPQSWGIEEAPEETEEPEDQNEEHPGELPYPTEFDSDGGQIIRKTYSYDESSTFVTLPGGGNAPQQHRYRYRISSRAGKHQAVSEHRDGWKPAGAYYAHPYHRML